MTQPPRCYSMDDGVKYDDWGWHIGGVFPDDQPPEHGMVHMAAYLAWIVRRGWYNPEFISGDDAQRIRAMEPGAAVRLMDMMDGKLVDELMNPEAKGFSDFYYERYLADWEAAFRDLPVYGVPDTSDTHNRATALIDRRYDDWVRRGRPAPRKPRFIDPRWRYLKVFVGYGLVLAAIAFVAIAGVVFDLRSFPWPLVQVALVLGVIGLVLWRGWLSD
jgi:hypothetical protein